MHMSVCRYVINTVYLVHVSATDATILREMCYNRWIHRNITEDYEPFCGCKILGKGKAIPLQAWTGPEGSRRLRLPDFKTIST
jgi:hypothetical protein